jgi:hypothetical protein
MTHRMSFEGPTLIIHFTGTLTPADLEAVADAMLAVEEEGTYTPHRLTDLRGVTQPMVGYAEVAQPAERSRNRPLVAPIRSAILVGQPVQLGLARMFQILNDHPQITLRIFEDDGAARAWIAGEDVDV